MLRGVVVQKGKKGRYGYTFGYTFCGEVERGQERKRTDAANKTVPLGR
jgi:hypothetical protein